MQGQFTKTFTQLGEDLVVSVNPKIGEAVRQASYTMAKEAAQRASKRQRPGPHRKMHEITDLKVYGDGQGWTGGIRSPAWYAWFQNDGTLAARKKPLREATYARRLSRSGQARFAKVAGNKGIKPLKFLDEALAITKTQLTNDLNNLFGR